jgi:hypothetical protein
MLIDRFHPFVQELVLGFVLIGVLALGFKNQIASGLSSDDEVRPVLMYDAFEDVKHLETEMVVLTPAVNECAKISVATKCSFGAPTKDNAKAGTVFT